jgi:ribonuclease P protein subunit POP4
MNRTADCLLSHEIIGLGLTIIDSGDPTLRGVEGTVVSETRNTISVRTDSNRTKKVAKKTATRMEFRLASGACFINGTSLIGRPEDRISRLR